ncbi:VOC family protein [Microbispora sp. NPDC088329]|uniref:VOC family protein n=1 Tax=Microbispora sp. NPDC088329 TaxID=3154869 RepID=UPI003412922B
MEIFREDARPTITVNAHGKIGNVAIPLAARFLWQGAPMTMETLFAAVAVEAFPGAVEWYARLFGRAADVVVADNEVMWRVADTAWLYVIEDAGRAGRSLVTISVSDLDQAVAELDARGIRSGDIETVGDAGRKATVTDPEGNAIALIQIAAT